MIRRRAAANGNGNPDRSEFLLPRRSHLNETGAIRPVRQRQPAWARTGPYRTPVGVLVRESTLPMRVHLSWGGVARHRHRTCGTGAPLPAGAARQLHQASAYIAPSKSEVNTQAKEIAPVVTHKLRGPQSELDSVLETRARTTRTSGVNDLTDKAS